MVQPLELDGESFGRCFGVGPCAVRHRLADHELLTVEAIAKLAEALPADRVEHNVGRVPVVLGDREPERVEQSPGEIARGIEDNGCWMVLKNIERQPAYAALLDECLDQVEPYVAHREGGMGLREGFVFLSAPGSVTPAHFDPEHNFLLQIRGEKVMNVGRFPDKATEQNELERYYGGGGRNIEWKPENVEAFVMGPGDGVYLPVHAPHYVTVPDNVAISLSITFRTGASADAVLLNKVNRNLRRLRLAPRPAGERPRSDRAKVALARTAKLATRRLRGTSGTAETPAGM